MNGFLGFRFYLLHYKSMGLQYLLKRNNDLRLRRGEFSKSRNIATHYLRNDVEIEREFNNNISNAVKVVDRTNSIVRAIRQINVAVKRA
jgi:hypothetical protein